tara:strand:+ start:210 stop:395 length:186 start_codon:yes stop_codon:yes gene_type:complete
MKTCPECESYIVDDDRCAKCEEDHQFGFGLKASRRRKQEQLEIKWDEAPNEQNCGVRKQEK